MRGLAVCRHFQPEGTFFTNRDFIVIQFADDDGTYAFGPPDFKRSQAPQAVCFFIDGRSKYQITFELYT